MRQSVLEKARGLGRIAFTAVQATWGFPQTVSGAAVFLAHARRPHFAYHGAVVTTWESRKALSLGPFIFMRGSAERRDAYHSVDKPLLVHEYGHCIQSLVLGPAYLLVIGVPSVMWLNVPALARKREQTGASYYAFYTERLASYLGERLLRQPAAR